MPGSLAGKEVAATETRKTESPEKENPPQQPAQVSRQRVMQELASIAFCRMTDYVRVEDGRAVALNTDSLPEDAARAIVSIKEGTKGVEIKLGDKLRALELLGRSVGLFDREEPQQASLPLILDDISEQQDE